MDHLPKFPPHTCGNILMKATVHARKGITYFLFPFNALLGIYNKFIVIAKYVVLIKL